MAATEVIRLGVCQPRAAWGAEAARNVDDAVAFVRQAAALEIDLLLFPETYPGPYTNDLRYEVVPPLREAAAHYGVALVAGTTTETEPGSGAFHVEAVVIDAAGEEVGRYRRSHPLGPYVFPGGSFWDLNYKEGDELPVFDLGWGKVGVAICSEVFVPEIARTLALKGAEVCLFPTGILIDEFGYSENWRTLVRARAIENLMYTATTIHLFPREFLGADAAAVGSIGTGSGLTAGHAMICSPERTLAATHEPGILTADLDLAHLRRLRETEEVMCLPAPFRTIPGVLAWRRPELYELGALEAVGA